MQKQSLKTFMILLRRFVDYYSKACACFVCFNQVKYKLVNYIELQGGFVYLKIREVQQALTNQYRSFL